MFATRIVEIRVLGRASLQQAKKSTSRGASSHGHLEVKTLSNWRAFNQASIYRIRVKGALDEKWQDWFDGFAITPQTDDEITTLIGPVADQAALHGLLAKICDLGLPLLLVEYLAPGDGLLHQLEPRL